MKNVNFLSDVVIAPLNEKQDLTGNIEGSKKSQNFQEFKRRKSRKKSSMKDKFSPELLQLQKDRTIFNNDGYCMVKLDNKKSHGDYFENGKIRFAGENVQSKPCICTSDGYMLKWSQQSQFRMKNDIDKKEKGDVLNQLERTLWPIKRDRLEDYYQHFQREHCSKGYIIYNYGEISKYCYVQLSGTAKELKSEKNILGPGIGSMSQDLQKKNGDAGRKQTIRDQKSKGKFIDKGSVFGEKDFWHQNRRKSKAVVLSDNCHILSFTYEFYCRMTQENFRFSFAFEELVFSKTKLHPDMMNTLMQKASKKSPRRQPLNISPVRLNNQKHNNSFQMENSYFPEPNDPELEISDESSECSDFDERRKKFLEKKGIHKTMNEIERKVSEKTKLSKSKLFLLDFRNTKNFDKLIKRNLKDYEMDSGRHQHIKPDALKILEEKVEVKPRSPPNMIKTFTRMTKLTKTFTQKNSFKNTYDMLSDSISKVNPRVMADSEMTQMKSNAFRKFKRNPFTKFESYLHDQPASSVISPTMINSSNISQVLYQKRNYQRNENLKESASLTLEDNDFNKKCLANGMHAGQDYQTHYNMNQGSLKSTVNDASFVDGICENGIFSSVVYQNQFRQADNSPNKIIKENKSGFSAKQMLEDGYHGRMERTASHKFMTNYGMKKTNDMIWKEGGKIEKRPYRTTNDKNKWDIGDNLEDGGGNKGIKFDQTEYYEWQNSIHQDQKRLKKIKSAQASIDINVTTEEQRKAQKIKKAEKLKKIEENMANFSKDLDTSMKKDFDRTQVTYHKHGKIITKNPTELVKLLKQQSQTKNETDQQQELSTNELLPPAKHTKQYVNYLEGLAKKNKLRGPIHRRRNTEHFVNTSLTTKALNYNNKPKNLKAMSKLGRLVNEQTDQDLGTGQNQPMAMNLIDSSNNTILGRSLYSNPVSNDISVIKNTDTSQANGYKKKYEFSNIGVNVIKDKIEDDHVYSKYFFGNVVNSYEPKVKQITDKKPGKDTGAINNLNFNKSIRARNVAINISEMEKGKERETYNENLS